VYLFAGKVVVQQVEWFTDLVKITPQCGKHCKCDKNILTD